MLQGHKWTVIFKTLKCSYEIIALESDIKKLRIYTKHYLKNSLYKFVYFLQVSYGASWVGRDEVSKLGPHHDSYISDRVI